MTKLINYQHITDNVVSFLNSVNTSTAAYSISLGLTNKVTDINNNIPSVKPSFKSKYGEINVNLDTKNEEMIGFVNSNQHARKIKLNYNIYATVDSLTGPDNDLLTLTRNIEANLRDYIAMGGYNYDAQELYIELPSTDIVQIGNDTNINLTSKITMTIDLYLGDN